MNDQQIKLTVLHVLFQEGEKSENEIIDNLIKISGDLMKHFEDEIQQKEEDKKRFERFVDIIKDKGEIEGSKAIYLEIQNDERWKKMFHPFFKVGNLNLKIMETFVSVTSELIVGGLVFLADMKKDYDNIKKKREKLN